MPALETEKLFSSTEELLEAEVVKVEGKIPKYAHGTYLRVGPGKWDLDNGRFTLNHYMDGYSIISKFVIENDKISFQKKFLESDAYKRALSCGRPCVTEYATKAHTDKNKSLFSRLINTLVPIELTDNDNINLYNIGNDVFATSETCFFRQIEPCSLRSSEKFDSNQLFRTINCSAHIMTDNETGYSYNVGSSILSGLKYNVIKIPPTASNQSTKEMLKKSKIICSIPSSHNGYLSYIHSFGITKNYIILIEQPYVMNITKALKNAVLKAQAFKDWFEWHPEFKNRFHIIEKDTGKLIKTEYLSKNEFFFIHIINCYEEDNQIVIDLNACKDASGLDSLYLNLLRSGIMPEEKTYPQAERFIIPIITEVKNAAENIQLVEVKSSASAIRRNSLIELESERLSESGMELPVLNKKYIGKKYTYFWATGNGAPGFFANAITKIDTKKKSAILWRDGSNFFPGEPYFIPDPNPLSAEDEGVIVSAVTDSRKSEKDFLLFLNSQNLKEITRTYFTNHVPQAIHGLFLPQKLD